MRFFLVLAIGLNVSIGVTAFADSNLILNKLNEVQQKATRNRLDSLSASDSAQIVHALDRINAVLDGNAPPRPGPHGGNDRFSAVCHLDDDPQFDWDQIVVGKITGNTVENIRNDCAALATSRFGTNGSSGIKDIEYIQADRIQDRFSAVCHLDDDPQFDWDQIVVGKITGHNVDQIADDCKAIADARFGTNGSSNIKDVEFIVRTRPGDRFQGICHIDDDPQFDWDQIVIGKITAPQVTDIAKDCAAIAKARYGTNGSSNVKDIGPIN